MKTYVYVDGFNLYYGAVKGTPYKWLNINALCEQLLPKNEIIRIKYFTARVTGRADDPDQSTRQDTFLRALKTLPNIEIIFGHFLTNEVWVPRADSPPENRKYVKVIRTEEKGSDVNLATHLLADGFRGRYEVAVLITNDSDLLEPVRIVREELKLVVGILNPHKRTSRVLAKQATFVKQIRKGALKAGQFPDRLKDAVGAFTKPAAW